MNKEIWKPIEGYEGHYEISSFGRVRSLDRLIESNQERVGLANYKSIIRKQTTNKGYKRVGLTKETILKTYQVHRLVGVAFVENPNNKPQINHKDGKKDNNHFSNLEWCSHSENQLHRYNVLGKSNGGLESIPLFCKDLNIKSESCMEMADKLTNKTGVKYHHGSLSRRYKLDGSPFLHKGLEFEVIE